MTTRITITARETSARQGQFEAYYGERLLCTSRQPFLDAARVLLAEGADPSATLVMMRGDTVSLRGPIGRAAKLSVSEATNDGKPRFVSYRPFKQAGGGQYGGSGARARNGRIASPGRGKGVLPLWGAPG